MNEKEMFEIMVADWLTDNAEETADLKIGEAYQNEDGEWVADAEDEKCAYVLFAFDGDICLLYSGAE